MIKEALHAYVVENQRQFTHDRTKTIGASEIGQCARKLWFLKHGQAPDPGYQDRWGARKRGDLIEMFWVQALRGYFDKGVLHYAGRHQKTLVDAAQRLSATPDGLVVDRFRDWCFAVECKSIDPRAKLEEARPEHIFQVQVQLGLIRQLTRFQPEYGILTYIDASFLDESREFRIDFDAAAFAQAKTRALAIFAANEAEALRPEGYLAGGAECQHCPFRSSCSAMRATLPDGEERLPEEDMARVADLARLRAVAKGDAETAELCAKQAEEGIKEILRAHGSRRAEGNGVRVTWSALKGRPSFDMPRLRAAAQDAGLDLSPFETVGEPSDRLQIRLEAQRRDSGAPQDQAQRMN